MKSKVFSKIIKYTTGMLLAISVMGFSSQAVDAKIYQTDNSISIIDDSKRNLDIDSIEPLVPNQVLKTRIKDLIYRRDISKHLPNLAKNTPKINKFTPKKLQKYNLLGCVWQNPDKITYHYVNLTKAQKKMANDEIKRVNNLKLFHLVKSSSNKANITIQTQRVGNDGRFGVTTGNYYNGKGAKGLYFFYQEHIHLDDDTMEKFTTKSMYKVLFRHTILHELGHALGLAHLTSPTDEPMIMYPSTTKLMLTGKNKKPIIDRKYINSLAVLYKNY